MSATTPPPAPRGWVRLDNLGTPALIRAADIAAVHRNSDTHVVLRCALGPSGSLILHVSESVDEVGAAIAAAEAP